MADDDHAIFAHAHIQLQRAHAQLNGFFKGRQGVFGQEAARAAMALQIKRGGLGRGGSVHAPNYEANQPPADMECAQHAIKSGVKPSLPDGAS